MPSKLFTQLLQARGLAGQTAADFLAPSYDKHKHDPFLLPDMAPAVERLVRARADNTPIFIYGDYDIDGLTATTLLRQALTAFGFSVQTFIPNRFVEGYGLTKDAIRHLHERGAKLIVTVDCGSLSHAEIALAGQLGMEVIVTDHHNVAPEMPPAVATINPKRPGHSYPFTDLAGVGVAFKLVQALQTRLDGLPPGHEKWLLDLVALGTVCDVVTLQDENRANVHWGLHVLRKTRRPGIRALAGVAGVEVSQLNARHLGFVLGPHLNASGRLDTAQHSLDLLIAEDPLAALEIAQKLRQLNQDRRKQQDAIYQQALELAKAHANDPVLVLSHPDWSHGIIGIVAAKILEQLRKPAFVLQELEDGTAKGSARSYGDFSAADGIRASEQYIIKGGGHKLAAGVTLHTRHIPDFRRAINDYYRSLALDGQHRHLEARADLSLSALDGLDLALLDELAQLEPFGQGNPEPVFHISGVVVAERREMGADKQHLKLFVQDAAGRRIAAVGFNQAARVLAQPGEQVDIWLQLTANEWRGLRTAEGRLVRVE